MDFWHKQNDILFRRVLATKAFTLLKIATMGRDADIKIQEHVSKVLSFGTRWGLWQALLCWHILKNNSRQGIFSEEKTMLLNRVGFMRCPQIFQTCVQLEHVNIICNKLKFSALRDEETEHLFISSRPPHKKVQPKTVANWVKFSMEIAGVSTSQFKSYPMCGPGRSNYVWKGASLDVIIKNGRRKDEPPLKKYFRHFVP